MEVWNECCCLGGGAYFPIFRAGMVVITEMAADQQGFVLDLEACGAYYESYPPNCSVQDAPKTAEKVVAKGVAVGCATLVRSGRAAYADLVGQYLYSDARWVQESHEMIPASAMESRVGKQANPLGGALKPPVAHVPSLPPLPAHGGHSS
jgi:hypothetical protein